MHEQSGVSSRKNKSPKTHTRTHTHTHAHTRTHTHRCAAEDDGVLADTCWCNLHGDWVVVDAALEDGLAKGPVDAVELDQLAVVLQLQHKPPNDKNKRQKKKKKPS